MSDPSPASNAFAGAVAGGATGRELASACLRNLGAVPAGANLGFVYATDAAATDLRSILEALREETGIADWVGSVGIGVCATGIEIFDEPAIAVLLAALPGPSFRVVASTMAAERLGSDHRGWIEARHPFLGIVHGDPRRPELPEAVAQLAARTGCFLVGGVSSARGAPLQIAGRVVEGELSGVLLGSDIAAVTGLTQGCAPIGPVRRITAAHENLIMEIDDRPALDVLREEIGELLARDLRRIGGLIFAGFPIAASDTGDYLVRNLIAIDVAHRWIAVAAEVAAGDPILFCRRDPASAIKDLRRMLEEVRRRAGRPPKAGLYFTCLARGPNLFGAESEELGLIREALGDFPLAGFFANGEICNDRLYGYTGVLTLFL